MKKTLIILFFFFLYNTSSAQIYQEYLLSGWTFKEAGSEYWLPAEIPGSVQNDMLLNGRQVKKELKGDWKYHTTFTADEFILARERIELLFKGLDTQADVYLNKKLILNADNMFRSWAIPVKSVLKKGENILEITFHNILSPPDPSLRKAAYHFQKGKDSFGIPMGIGKAIILQSWNDYKLVEAFIRQEQLTNKEALMTAVIDIDAKPNSKLEVEIVNEISGRTFEKRQIIVQEKKSQFQIPFRIKNPKIWWPVSMGDPTLYKIGVRIKQGSNEQSLIKTIGLREVVIMPANDSTSMHIEVNGKIVAINSMNYEPEELFTSNMRSNDYNTIFDDLLNKKINMIHVLGTGIYESDYFYDLADTKGILIVQDFMFAQTKYPDTSDFFENVKAEVKANINHLKQHPSLILWIAGYEPVQDEEGSTDDLRKLLLESVKEFDPFRPFVNSIRIP